jgi:hypothetical protein
VARLTLSAVPENVAFDPALRSNRLHVMGGEFVVLGNFHAVTSLVLQDNGQTMGA